MRSSNLATASELAPKKRALSCIAPGQRHGANRENRRQYGSAGYEREEGEDCGALPFLALILILCGKANPRPSFAVARLLRAVLVNRRAVGIGSLAPADRGIGPPSWRQQSDYYVDEGNIAARGGHDPRLYASA
jgi:hypothetical protein